MDRRRFDRRSLVWWPRPSRDGDRRGFLDRLGWRDGARRDRRVGGRHLTVAATPGKAQGRASAALALLLALTLSLSSAEGWASPHHDAAPRDGQASRASAGSALVLLVPPRRPAELPLPRVDPQKIPAPSATPDTSPGGAATPAKTPPPGETRPAAPATSGCIASLMAEYGTAVRAVTIPPTKDAACAMVEPVEVEAISIGPGRQRIALLPPVTLSCTMALAVAQWLETSVQPLAKGYFSQDLTSLRVGGGHECRRRNRAANGPLSEHSTGQALDIFAIEIGDGKAAGTITVEKPEGPGHGAFLTALRQSACGAFMTSLGPGSDAAHANHLHIDIQPRQAASSRFCQ
ncbi:MAG: extensin family protein [Alsobacter sp.]